MKLHAVEVLERERFGDHTLLRYRWAGVPPEPGQFMMVRTADSLQALDPFLSRPFFAHDYDDEVVSLLFEIRGRGTALLTGKMPLLVTALACGYTIDAVRSRSWAGGMGIADKALSRHLAA